MILVVFGGVSVVVLVVLLIGYMSRQGVMFGTRGPTEYFSPADLKTMNLPQWQVTNAIPLAPDQAVLAAMRYLSVKRPSINSWDVRSIGLEKEFDTTWTYCVSLADHRTGSHEFEVVRVLMDGSVWKPTTEIQKR